MSEKKRVILVSGMSGAGKSTATKILEDMGFYIIENYPVQLVGQLVDMLEISNDGRYQNIVISTSASDFPVFLRCLNGGGLQVQVLFLDASDTTLLHRYKSTRRTHPLLLSNTCNTLEEAIAVERNMFAQYRNASIITVDTSFLAEKETKKKIEALFGKQEIPSFYVSFISFGYKYGVPLDADMMMDVRFLPNPFWDEQLRYLSGNDPEVYTYVMEKDETKQFIQRFIPFLDYALEQYHQEGKNHITVAIGCTGGQHRSVSIANYLYEKYHRVYHCYKEHRDEKEWNLHE